VTKLAHKEEVFVKLCKINKNEQVKYKYPTQKQTVKTHNKHISKHRVAIYTV